VAQIPQRAEGKLFGTGSQHTRSRIGRRSGKPAIQDADLPLGFGQCDGNAQPDDAAPDDENVHVTGEGCCFYANETGGWNPGVGYFLCGKTVGY
jgi:hypothetical protein